MKTAQRVLILAFGNPGRQDDGLGAALAAALERLALPGVTIDADYQLTVEHAPTIADHELTIFADADRTGPEPFSFRPIRPSTEVASFSTHALQPAELLALAVELFGAHPEAYVLAIRGYEFDRFAEGLSERARANLALAVDFVAAFVGRESRRLRAAEARRDLRATSSLESVMQQNMQFLPSRGHPLCGAPIDGTLSHSLSPEFATSDLGLRPGPQSCKTVST